MVIKKEVPSKGPKTPKQRLTELENSLEIGLKDPVARFFVRFLKKYIDPTLPTRTKRAHFLMLRDCLRDMSFVVDMEFDDIKELLAVAQLRSEALELLKKEMDNEEKVILAVGRSRNNMDESLSLIDNVHKARKDLSLAVNESELKYPLLDGNISIT